MIELEQAVKRFADRLLEATANAITAEIQANWSPSSPAPAGKPPGVVSGRLAASVRAEGHTVTVSAPYAYELEFGSADKAAHPFVRPAVRSIARQLGKIAQAVQS